MSKSLQRAKKRGLRTMPTSYKELAERLTALGCTITDGTRHYKVTLPDGTRRSLPKSTSDWRAVRNSVSMFRHAGVDVRRQ